MISFIVPAYNEERLLGRTLSAIHAAARDLAQPYELIVADDGSTDQTGEVARAHGAVLVQVRYRQISRTRNAGARASRGDYLIFIDADTVLTPAVLRATFDVLRQGAAGGGARFRFDGRLPLYARLLSPLVNAVMRAGGMAAGCYVFCSREAFEAVGGFDERLYGAEELVFSRALRRRGPMVILEDAVTTSGRKMRAYSGWELLRLFAGLLPRGLAGVRTPDRLAFWYSDRREDPG
jgi:glycosyltransferase involved in cell wall biosynthesis